jgi:hypothetical protein
MNLTSHSIVHPLGSLFRRPWPICASARSANRWGGRGGVSFGIEGSYFFCRDKLGPSEIPAVPARSHERRALCELWPGGRLRLHGSA